MIVSVVLLLLELCFLRHETNQELTYYTMQIYFSSIFCLLPSFFFFVQKNICQYFTYAYAQPKSYQMHYMKSILQSSSTPKRNQFLNILKEKMSLLIKKMTCQVFKIQTTMKMVEEIIQIPNQVQVRLTVEMNNFLEIFFY